MLHRHLQISISVDFHTPAGCVDLLLLTLVLPNDVDLFNPSVEHEKRKHKLKRLVQSPNSFFMGCFNMMVK
ncbi:hypothetical protein K7X08_023785 [Anisodus acutangulus]|uniref:Uncharacterized protein n=1 Tax=Anisodus acutangulus TaxID=402998 RepID=A0A9Q1QWX5_9SOLA|nr:hypothetical protein K7X08_023785 [Anisodus acutangulus]